MHTRVVLGKSQTFAHLNQRNGKTNADFSHLEARFRLAHALTQQTTELLASNCRNIVAHRLVKVPNLGQWKWRNVAEVPFVGDVRSSILITGGLVGAVVKWFILFPSATNIFFSGQLRQRWKVLMPRCRRCACHQHEV